MIPELGHFALIVAGCLAAAQTVVPAAGVWRRQPAWMRMADGLSRLQFVFIAISYAALTHAFVADDFSVAYVAANGNTNTPLIYKITGVWGAHEGSLLLWALMLAGWGAALSLSQTMPVATRARALAVHGAICAGFLLFALAASNPFSRLSPPPAQGRELNPLLQDFGLAVHPPMLYMGYVGFSVVFALAIAALQEGRMDAAWARRARLWANAAWCFLTAGIALGSWWAYYELGWGGWWFWDPVENASFMPWLAGAALVHSLAATEARGAYRAWTAFLALLAFSLSLLGAFIVRSGILTSVHAFATDPARGLFILVFLALVIGASLLLFALRANHLASLSQARLFSREGGLLLNNTLMCAALASVFVGTLYPLLLEVAGGGKISVGAPYFNSVFVPIAAPLAVLAGAGALLRWKKDSAARVASALRRPAVFAVLAGALLPLLFDDYRWGAALALGLAAWLFAASGKILLSWRGGRPPLATIGMTLGHIGLAAFVAGAGVVSAHGMQKDVRMAVGDARELGGYQFIFAAPVTEQQVANYRAQIGEVRVLRHGELLATLRPEKRFYESQTRPLTEAAIAPGLWRDLYVSLGEPLGDGAWSMRLQVKPLVRWIWGGAALIALGAALAAAAHHRRGQ